MSVKIRRRKNSDGTTSLLLDIYHNGQRSYEFLKDLKLLKPTSPIDREENRQRIKLSEQIKNKREQELQGEASGVIASYKKNIDFIKFFESYIDKYDKKDKRVIKGCLYKFKEFLIAAGNKNPTTKEVNENLIMDFKDYLEKNLNGETPANYFKKFKRVLKYGVKHGVFLFNPAQDVSIKRMEGIKKDIFTFEEIQQLANTTVTNNEVKRAFLFSCCTGLRYCDICKLKWSDINNGILIITQLKTGKPVTINLNETALQLLKDSTKSGDRVFNLPSYTACLKNLRVWCKKAAIKKRISWHCARHSFGTALILYGGDVNNVSSLLGHTSFAYTMRYVRISEKLKDKAVSNLPKIILNN